MSQLFAVVDVETTGGYAADNRMTEIAVVIHDGKEILETYETLLNPGIPIPPYIIGYTGISNEMVQAAPAFRNIANRLYQLLEGKIFVAHNVNFDFSFVQKAFSDAGITYKAPRLCTVRLSRKIFPGLKSYSLGNLCQQLGIDLSQAHRAGADCKATADLLKLLHDHDEEGQIAATLKKSSKELTLPPNLVKKQFDALPTKPGIYYFTDAKGKVIYVGKAINLKQRVASHFAGKNESERKQVFLREIYGVKFELTGSELLALLIEVQEIKRLWPKYNSAYKRPNQRFGLFQYQDRSGIINLRIDKVAKFSRPLLSFQSQFEARNAMESIIKDFGLQRRYCTQDTLEWTGEGHSQSQRLASADEINGYNQRVKEAIQILTAEKSSRSFAIQVPGRTEFEEALIFVKDHQFRGYLYRKTKKEVGDLSLLLEKATPVNHYPESMHIIHAFLEKINPNSVVYFG